jgi:hypothetical protein
MKLMTVVLGLSALSASALGDGLSGSGMIVLNPSASGALSMTGNATVRIPARAVYVNSTNSRAVTTSGNATLDCPNLYMCGNAVFSGHSGVTGQVTRTAVAYGDPLSGVAIPNGVGMPSYPQSSQSGGTVTLQPGYYPNGYTVSGQGSVILAPGTFVFGGAGFRMSGQGTLSGAGVTMVIASGSFSLSGQGAVTLSPPASGSLASVVVVQPSANHNGLSMSGGSNMLIRGAVYSPGATISMSGNSTVEGTGPQMGDIVIADRVVMSGNAEIRIGSRDMIAIVPPKLPYAD